MKKIIILSVAFILTACGSNDPQWDGSWNSTVDGESIKMNIIGNPEDPTDEKMVNITIGGETDSDLRFCKMVEPITNTATIICYSNVMDDDPSAVLTAEFIGNTIEISDDSQDEIFIFKRN